RAAVRSANAAGPDLGIHGIDEFAHRHVEIVAMHEIDIDIIGLEAIQRLSELFADDVGIDQRRMGALADQHRVFAHAAAFLPVAEQLFGIAPRIDIGGVEDIAAALPESVEQDGAGGEGAEILKAQSHGRSLLGEARNGALGDNALIGAERAIVERAGAHRGLFDGEFDPRIGTPLVEYAQIAQRVVPAHARGVEFLFARQNGQRSGLGLEGIDMRRLVYAGTLGLAALDDVDAAQALVAIAAREPEIGHLDPALGAVDAQHIVEIG